jgi:hypothetical protein
MNCAHFGVIDRYRQKSDAEREEQSTQAFSDGSKEETENEENFSQRAEKRPSPELYQSHKRPKKMLQSEGVVLPVMDFLNSNSEKGAQDHPLLDFVKGLVPDFEQLSGRRQRVFKLRTITLLNELLDEEESEATDFPSRATTPTS